MEAWYVVDRDYDMNNVDSIGSFKLNIFPDWLINKLKSRLFYRGDQ